MVGVGVVTGLGHDVEVDVDTAGTDIGDSELVGGNAEEGAHLVDEGGEAVVLVEVGDVDSEMHSDLEGGQLLVVDDALLGEDELQLPGVFVVVVAAADGRLGLEVHLRGRQVRVLLRAVHLQLDAGRVVEPQVDDDVVQLLALFREVLQSETGGTGHS